MKVLDVDTDNPAHRAHSNYLIPTNGYRAECIESDLPLHESTISKLLEELEGHYKERCGIITTENNIVYVPNSHEDPHSNFYMDADDGADALNYIRDDLQENILGIWHTHPNGYPWPTPRDICGWPNLSLGWRYFLVTRGAVSEWVLVHD